MSGPFPSEHLLFLPINQCNVSVLLMFSLGTDTGAILLEGWWHFWNIIDKLLTLLTNLLMFHLFSKGTLAYQKPGVFLFKHNHAAKKKSLTGEHGTGLQERKKQMVGYLVPRIGSGSWNLSLSLLMRRSPVLSQHTVRGLHRPGKRSAVRVRGGAHRTV